MSTIDPSYLEELNREYSPSSCVEDINVYLQQYIDLSITAKAQAKEQNTISDNIQYGTSDTQSLDLYLPTKTPKNKLMVYIHGGYWQQLSKDESSFAASNFQKQGFHYAVLDYTLAPDTSLTEIVDENRKAIAYLYQNASQFGYKPEEIYVSGSSAGAHLAMMMLQTVWSEFTNHGAGNIIRGVCAVSGIYDLQPLVPTYVNEPLKMDIKEAKANSPYFQPLSYPVPIIIAYGNNETKAFKQQSLMMVKKLRDNGFDIQHKEIDDRNHFDVIIDLADESSWLSKKTMELMA